MPLGNITNLDYTILLCTKLKETRAFYEDVMGFAVEVDRENWISFRIGGALLTLRPRSGIAGAQDGPAVDGSAAVQLAFRVAPLAVDTCHAELMAKGVAIIRPPTDLPDWRHRTLFFRDPEGNVLEIFAEY